MKTIKLSFLAVLFIALSSCSKDDEPNANSSTMLGEWNLNSMFYDGKTELIYDDSNFTTSYNGTAKNIDFTLTFNADNTFNAQGGYDVDLIIEGISQTVSIEDYMANGDWSIDGNKLITSTNFAQMSNGDVMPAESTGDLIIQELTDNRMVLRFEQISNFETSGFENIATISGEYILTR